MRRCDLEKLEVAAVAGVEYSDNREIGLRCRQPKQSQGSRLERAKQHIDRMFQGLAGRPDIDDATAHPLYASDQQLAIAIAGVHHRALDISEIDARGCRLQRRTSLMPNGQKRVFCSTEILSTHVCSIF